MSASRYVSVNCTLQIIFTRVILCIINPTTAKLLGNLLKEYLAFLGFWGKIRERVELDLGAASIFDFFTTNIYLDP